MLQYRFVYDNFREKGKTKMNLTKQFFKYVSQNIFGLLGTSCYILADTYFIQTEVATSDQLFTLWSFNQYGRLSNWNPHH